MSSLEDAAAARKQKLLALKKRKAEAESGEVAMDGEPADKQARHDFKFRSYDPTTGQARKHDKATDEIETVEQATAGVVQQAIREDEQRRREELDLFNIQPKKANWDLKRDLEKRLEKVRPKTEAAINTLIRRRLAVSQKGTSNTIASQGGEDVAEAISRRRIEDEEALSDEDEV